jgi:hypothetical protein
MLVGDVAGLFESLAQRGHVRLIRSNASDAEKSDHAHAWPLGVRGERARRHTSNNTEKFSPPHVCSEVRLPVW